VWRLRESPVAERDDPFKTARLGDFGCFGRSYVFLFTTGGRALQAHVEFGREASQERRARLYVFSTL